MFLSFIFSIHYLAYLESKKENRSQSKADSEGLYRLIGLGIIGFSSLALYLIWAKPV
jgi:hypothetical protein